MALTKVDISLVDNATGFTIVTKIVTVAASKLVIDGVSQDTLTLTEGYTYKFDTSHATMSGHTVSFATAADAAGSTQYTTGVTTSGTPGSANAYTQIVVAQSAPALYYYCANHASMGGTISTPAAVIANKLLAYDGSGNLPVVDGSQLINVVTGITNSTNDPTISTNPSGGVGTEWCNTTSGEVYICTDATAGENVWTNVGGGSGDVQPWVYQGESDGYSAGGARDSSVKISKFSLASNTTATLHGDLSSVSNDGSRPGMSSPTHGFATHGGSTVLQKFAFAGSSVSGSSHGDLATRMDSGAMASNNETHGFVTGGYENDDVNKFAFASNTTAAGHGNIPLANFDGAGQSSATHGYASGGHRDGGPGAQDTIYKYAFSSNTTATDIGNLTGTRRNTTGQSSATHGYTSGGKWGQTGGSNVIDKFPFASDTNAVDVGDLTAGRNSCGGHSSTTHGYTSNGTPGPPGGGFSNVIDKFSFASDGNATDHGDDYWATGTGNINCSTHHV